jgi:hypothetical protein
VNDIKVSVNLATFTVAVIVWIALGVLTALPSYTLPPSLSFLFATLTGVILTIVQGFEKGVTFSSTTETASSTTTTTATSPAETGIPASTPDAAPKPEPE